VTGPLADSNVSRADQDDAWVVAQLAASRKLEKYAKIVARCITEPTAVVTLGIINTAACHLLNDLDRRMTVNSGETRETSFLYHRISVLIQCYNAVLIHNGLPNDSTH